MEDEAIKSTPEIKLQPGLRAYRMPELRTQSRKVGWREMEAPTSEEAQSKIDAILNNIQSQGGRLVAILPIEVQLLPEAGIVGIPTEIQNFLIVDKPGPRDL